MSGRVVMRARSGASVGMGHAMRSRSVAQEIRRLGGEPFLVVDEERTAAVLAEDGLIATTERDWPAWADESASGAWLDGPVDWSAELERLSESGTPTFLVENRGPARELCDRVVYPTLHYVPDAWDAAHPARILAGPGWVPLARDVRSVDTGVDRDVDVLITFGGCDPFRLTERVLSALDLSLGRIVVAVGPHMAERRDELLALVAGAPDVRILLPGMPLARWMARSRTAVTAVGTTLYELAYLGVPAAVVANYDEDHDALEWYERNGPHLPVGIAADVSQEGLRASLRSGLAELRARETSRALELGGGATRLAESLLGRVA